MAYREEQAVSTEQGSPIGGDEQFIDTHPAFGTATVVRSIGTPRSLFQSDLRHNETIVLRISRADRTRSLNRDRVHQTGDLIEVEMSLAQWGAFVSSMGIGSGVPVTIRRTEQEVYVPAIPYEPRTAESINEVRGAVGKLLAHARETFENIEAAFEEKRGVKAQREALRLHKFSLENAEANSAFAVDSLKDAAEDVVSQARADIEAHIVNAMSVTGGQASIEAPFTDLFTPQIES